MIELSGYTGKSANSVRDRLLASREMKATKPSTHKKFKIKYSVQTLIMGNGFSVIEDGHMHPTHIESEVNSIEDFERYVIDNIVKKHKNPHLMKNGGKHTIFSQAAEDMLYVDIVEFNMN